MSKIHLLAVFRNEEAYQKIADVRQKASAAQENVEVEG